MNRLHIRQSLLYLVAVILTASVGWHSHKWYSRHHEIQPMRQARTKGYEFTSPLLDIELPAGLNIYHEPMPFKYKIDSFVQEKIDSGQVQNIAVYYRDLLDGPWFGINAKTEFDPASMMKVAVMVAWLKRAERDQRALRQLLKYDLKDDAVPEQNIKPARTIISGHSYTVDDLLLYMMNYSDNKATSLLYKALSEKELADVLDSMDVNNNPHDGNNSVTVHGYSGFFRILYNASYLNREMSEKALRILSLQDFPQGIAAGVPIGIKVAAKFGENISNTATGGDIQLHEFGIVYHPKGHYILGIMTQGGDLTRQAEIIKEISKMIYTEVDNNPGTR